MEACPDHETLSAFADGEARPWEAAAARRHEQGCAACRARLASLRAAKAALAGYQAPEMPAELRASLRRLARPARRSLISRLSGLASPRARPAGAAALAAACWALLLWARDAGLLRRPIGLPAEVLAAAHYQYALTLPLAPAEDLSSELPPALASADAEGADVY